MCVLLVALTWLVFGQTLRHEFVNYDDPDYVYQNSQITEGLSMSGIQWAFASVHARNWHPLATISHMLDCELFGLNAAGHHFTSVLLHGVTALLLLLVLHQMTGHLWRSAFVAAAFAVHPLRVESVAWIAERKDVLSGLFFMLTLLAYVRYARNRSAARYLAVTAAFILGLLSKPMLVTLPLVLLLVDYWPLRRFEQSPGVTTESGSRAAVALLIEKVPLFALSGVAALITYSIQQTGTGLRDALPLTWRINNAVVSCVAYLWDLVWPTDLAPFYPHPEGRLQLWMVALSAGLVLAVTVAAVVWRRQRPYLVTGWLWYVVMLVPVIGLVDVGAQSRADRYTYLPQIGIVLAVTWAFVEMSAKWRHRQKVLVAGAILILVACSWSASVQTGRWRTSESLWRHTLEATSANHVAYNNLGNVFSQRGQIDEALAHYQQAVEIRSRNRLSQHDFLMALYQNNVGTALQLKGRIDEAIRHYHEAIRLQPDYGDVYQNLSGALAARGDVAASIEVLRKLLELQPANARAHADLGTLLLHTGNERDAVACYEEALRIAPRTLPALNNLTWLLATSGDLSVRNGAKAVALAEQALRIIGSEDPFFLHKVAAAHAANGGFEQAREVARRAMELAGQRGDAALARELQRNIALYDTGRAVNDPRGP